VEISIKEIGQCTRALMEYKNRMRFFLSNRKTSGFKDRIKLVELNNNNDDK
jgi:hypothetical protein